MRADLPEAMPLDLDDTIPPFSAGAGPTWRSLQEIRASG